MELLYWLWSMLMAALWGLATGRAWGGRNTERTVFE